MNFKNTYVDGVILGIVVFQTGVSLHSKVPRQMNCQAPIQEGCHGAQRHDNRRRSGRGTEVDSRP